MRHRGNDSPLPQSVLVLDFIKGLVLGRLTSCGGQEYVGRSFYKGSHF